MTWQADLAESSDKVSNVSLEFGLHKGEFSSIIQHCRFHFLVRVRDQLAQWGRVKISQVALFVEREGTAVVCSLPPCLGKALVLYWNRICYKKFKIHRQSLVNLELEISEHISFQRERERWNLYSNINRSLH